MALLIYTILAVVIIVILVMAIIEVSAVIALFQTKGVPYVPLDKKQLESVNRMIKVSANDTIVDLGCGDGRVLRLFEHQGAKDLTGYELNWWAYKLGQWKNKRAKSKVKVFQKNFTKVDLSKYNIVFCYLLESYLSGLRDQFDQQLKSGTKIVSYGFEIKDWHTPTAIYYTSKQKYNLGRIFVYTIK